MTPPTFLAVFSEKLLPRKDTERHGKNEYNPNKN